MPGDGFGVALGAKLVGDSDGLALGLADGAALGLHTVGRLGVGQPQMPVIP